MTSNPTVAVLGLGEAGHEIARDLVTAGALVRGFDPKVSPPAGVQECRDDRHAVETADVVLSVNSAHDAMAAWHEGKRALSRGAVWADLNTSAAGLKRALDEHCTAAGALFADVALMSPVPGNGLRTPMTVSGPGAQRYADLLSGLGARVTVLHGPAGLAATRKLLRSVFFKGLAAAVVEALTAAREAGCEEWLRENIVQELSGPNITVDRLESGTYRHATRRAHEMAAAAELLSELGVAPRIAAASRDLLLELSEQQSELS